MQSEPPEESEDMHTYEEPETINEQDVMKKVEKENIKLSRGFDRVSKEE